MRKKEIHRRVSYWRRRTNVSRRRTNVAQSRGFPTEREMLIDLYERSCLSVRQLAEMISRSATYTRERLLVHGIGLRARGGVNRCRETIEC